MSSLNMAATRNNNSMWFGHPMALAKGGGMETSVLEIQRAVLKLQQQQQQPMSTDQLTHQFPQLPTQQLIEAAYNTNDFSAAESELSDILAPPVKADPGLDYGFGWPEFEGFVRSGVTTTTTSTITTSCCCNNNMDMSSSCSCGVDQSTNTSSCPPSSVLVAGAAAAAAVSVHATKERPLIPEKWSVVVGRESFNKRKVVDKTVLHPPKPEDGKRVKKIKGGCVIDEEKTAAADKNKCTTNGGNSKKNMNGNRIKGPTEFTVSAGCTSKSKTNESKPASEEEDQKTEYIHVRARRGQATDSHSLAERVRRERISERMKYLQDLVPGCDKVTGKAGMLDEIINYVQSLQRQVEFLSMKLASVSPTIDLNFDDILAKQVYAAAGGYSSNYPMTMGAEMMTSNNDNNIHYDQMTHQVGQNCEIDMVGMGVAGTRRTISTYPVETSLDSSSLMLQHKQMESCLAWDTNNTDDLHHTIYSTMEFNNQQQSKVGGEGQSVFPSHQPLFSGATEEAGCLKMEM